MTGDCSDCDGSGLGKDWLGEPRDCPECGGDGESDIVCKTCKGSGDAPK